MPQEKAISLFELNQRLRDVVKESFSIAVWIRAEVAELRENRNGHCYLDLIEKDEASDQVIARMKAMIWSYNYRMIKPYFETTAGRPLSQGIKIMVRGVVEFQELYGISFIIRDIDPAYTLGDLAQRRREVLLKLQEEGVVDMNKELSLPLVPQRIAVISSPTAAGYGDFVHQLRTNSRGIIFYPRLFPALMQGEQASASIIAALDKVFENSSLFDVVVIIRGGGASLDLLCFDDYWLASHIAQFPVPVLTGIGHERDTSVADLVAHTYLKTPTAVAEFLISGTEQVLEKLDEFSETLMHSVRRNINQQTRLLDKYSYNFTRVVKELLQIEKHGLQRITEKLPVHTSQIIRGQREKINQFSQYLSRTPLKNLETNRNDLNHLQSFLRSQVKVLLKQELGKMEFYDKSCRLNDPILILNRGFTISKHNGKVVKDVSAISPGEILETRFRDGIAVSEVISKSQEK
ncbi:exodeoxyribonuclease VII large subunit [Alkalitalea saponilacus]|uniref:Exodeoxyribonuclease 7 large subunit n=1 Tax=Alkalitalea saponilacus TaxID=889453 RepID=A0A1T5HHJ2_9BACT|nr:exodeoxyribonuclease VII large subunit [Alkalitalea saponilacus]ASB48143.1 exodeoxyribonuclease VII large subunit [Alkalitalea saponilacus]SKC20112.1 Exodeoxyribonuclease VII large subunit [Alkalitalea saponilacus]